MHAGDTVVFHYVGVGEPHTVTLGSLANSAVSAYNNLTPAQQNSENPPASFRAIDATLPNLFPQGPGDAIASAANPCYMPSAAPRHAPSAPTPSTSSPSSTAPRATTTAAG